LGYKGTHAKLAHKVEMSHNSANLVKDLHTLKPIITGFPSLYPARYVFSSLFLFSLIVETKSILELA
jgi:hypothetical protein